MIFPLSYCVLASQTPHLFCYYLVFQSRCDLYIGLCSERPCKNDATCSPRGQDDYVCDCKQGYTGK